MPQAYSCLNTSLVSAHTEDAGSHAMAVVLDLTHQGRLIGRGYRNMANYQRRILSHDGHPTAPNSSMNGPRPAKDQRPHYPSEAHRQRPSPRVLRSPHEPGECCAGLLVSRHQLTVRRRLIRWHIEGPDNEGRALHSADQLRAR